MNHSSKRILAGVLCASMTVGLCTPALSEELTEDQGTTEELWYTDSCEYMESMGYLDQLPEGSYAPGLTASRAVLASILADIANVDLDAEAYQTTEFRDVMNNAWYTSAIAWATQNGIINGLEEDYFGVNVGTTREQLATMLYRFVNYCGVELTASETAVSSFQDEEEVSDWASEAVSALRSAGIISGDEEGCFNPDELISCSEAQVMCCRVIQLLEDADTSSSMLDQVRLELEEYGEGGNDGSEYIELYGTDSMFDTGDWSCSFLYYCASQVSLSGYDSAFGTVKTSVEEVWNYFHSLEQCSTRGEGYVPQTGDLIFYYSESIGYLVHIGIVERYDVETNTVYTIESSLEDGCLTRQTVQWDPDSSDRSYLTDGIFAYGFATPDYENVYEGIDAATLTSTQTYEIADYIFETLVDNGFSTAAACGVLGNIYAESRFNYTIDGENGTGLCQWTDTRRDSLIAYCEANGYSYLSLEGQVAFLMYSDLWAQDSYFWTNGGISASSYKTLTDVSSAARLFALCYERPQSSDTSTRESIALAFYDRYVNAYTGSIGDLG